MLDISGGGGDATMSADFLPGGSLDFNFGSTPAYQTAGDGGGGGFDLFGFGGISPMPSQPLYDDAYFQSDAWIKEREAMTKAAVNPDWQRAYDAGQISNSGGLDLGGLGGLLGGIGAIAKQIGGAYQAVAPIWTKPQAQDQSRFPIAPTYQTRPTGQPIYSNGALNIGGAQVPVSWLMLGAGLIVVVVLLRRD